MPLKSIPQLGDSNWGTPLNAHISQLQNPANGAINSFDQFSGRPTNLTSDDAGKTYLYTQTGNIHQWNGNTWKVLNESVINVKDYGAVGDGVTDDTVAVQSVANIAKTIKKSIFIPNGIFLIDNTIEVSGLEIFGNSISNSIIKATNKQFDIFLTVGGSYFRNFTINGGWDGQTAGQLGNSIFLNPLTSANIFVENMNIAYSKENAIKLLRAAYSHILSVTSRVSGLNAVYITGLSGADASTTVDINGSCTFSDCPNGYGVKVENGINISLNTITTEYTKGFGIFGNDNRSINITNCYQENINGNKFVDWNGAGIGMNIFGNFGGGTVLDYNPNYFGVNCLGNTVLTMPNTTYNWNMVQDENQNIRMSKATSLLGVNFNNQGGGSPAHIFNTAPISGLNKSIIEFQNNSNPKLKIDSEGGINITSSGFNVGHITLGTNHIWVDATGKLRIKNGQPTSDIDGTIVGLQS
jgi:hypothetical protein